MKWGLALADVTFEAQFAGKYFNFLPVLGHNFGEIETKNFKNVFLNHVTGEQKQILDTSYMLENIQLH